MDINNWFDEILKGGTFLTLVKMWWDRHVERQKEKATADATKMTAEAAFQQKILDMATSMTETIMQSLREEVSALKAEVAQLHEQHGACETRAEELAVEVATLKAGNKQLRERIVLLEEHHPS